MTLPVPAQVVLGAGAIYGACVFVAWLFGDTKLFNKRDAVEQSCEVCGHAKHLPHACRETWRAHINGPDGPDEWDGCLCGNPEFEDLPPAPTAESMRVAFREGDEVPHGR